MAPTGVFSSWLTLATKSVRTASSRERSVSSDRHQRHPARRRSGRPAGATCVAAGRTDRASAAAWPPTIAPATSAPTASPTSTSAWREPAMCSLAELRNSTAPSASARRPPIGRHRGRPATGPARRTSRTAARRRSPTGGGGDAAQRSGVSPGPDEGAHRQSDDQEQDRHGVGQSEPGSGTPSGTGIGSASSDSTRERYRAAPTCSGIQPVMR